MNLKEKMEKALDFVANEFTWASYASLHLFSLNVQHMIRLIELGGIVLKKIENGEIKHTMSDEQLLRMKHLILLDSLAKLMMIIEGVLALCSVLSDPKARKRDIAHRMMWYTQKQIDAFIERFKRNKVSIRKIAGFPDLAKLHRNIGLTGHERRLIWELFEDSCAMIRKALEEIVDFYQNNRVVYGKFKHGLTILLGLKVGSQGGDSVPSTVSLVLDHRPREPPSICVRDVGPLPPEYQWFNTISILPYWKATFDKYSGIMSDIRKMVIYITNNHLLWAENCGEDYFPVERQTNKWVPTIYTTKSLSQYESVIEKITANMNCVDRLLNVQVHLKGESLKKISECLQRDQVATIFSPIKEVHGGYKRTCRKVAKIFTNVNMTTKNFPLADRFKKLKFNR